jgi:HAMP domain-containing protein
MSLAVVRVQVPRGNSGKAEPITAGPWRHVPPPPAIPDWVVERGGFRGTLALVQQDAPADPELIVRSVQVLEGPGAGFAVVVDLPFDGEVIETLHDRTGIRAGSISLRDRSRARPLIGRLRRAARAITQAPGGRQPSGEQPPTPATGQSSPRRVGIWERSIAFLENTDWETGASDRVSISLNVTPRDLYTRISSPQPTLAGSPLGTVFVLFLVFIASLFIIIQLVALTMGVALARSITGAVHELFTGTERVRQGDFTHRIAVKAQDQLGELAMSFNTMTESIEHLLQTEAEKKRLEEELRIAREIQMSLLPRAAVSIPGLEVTALCIPAREVGGDYYDYFPLGDGRVAILVADVSGKGTSAALYMAELKGLLLSLAQRYDSPRELLIEVNRILSPRGRAAVSRSRSSPGDSSSAFASTASTRSSARCSRKSACR